MKTRKGSQFTHPKQWQIKGVKKWNWFQHGSRAVNSDIAQPSLSYMLYIKTTADQRFKTFFLKTNSSSVASLLLGVTKDWHESPSFPASPSISLPRSRRRVRDEWRQVRCHV